jgi:hypothetical protein
MASVKRDDETKRSSDTAIRAHIATLRRLKKTRKAAGVPPDDDRIDREITWSASRLRRDTTGRLRTLHTRPSPTAAAVALACELVTGGAIRSSALASTDTIDGSRRRCPSHRALRKKQVMAPGAAKPTRDQREVYDLRPKRRVAATQHKASSQNLAAVESASPANFFLKK